ncbi:MAG: hypothetical protein ACE15E_17635 [Acidobacteriota bacterium]
MLDTRIATTWWALRIALGATAFLAGLDKFFNLLTNWSMYLSPFAEGLLPFSGNTFMQLIGVIEMAVGIVILFASPRFGGYIASAWLVAISINLVLTGVFFDLAVRDLVMAVAAFSLARLSEYRQEVTASESRSELASDHSPSRA